VDSELMKALVRIAAMGFDEVHMPECRLEGSEEEVVGEESLWRGALRTVSC
jgi:hypothetical protein